MKKIVKVLAVALIALAAHVLEARNLKIVSDADDQLFLKQINIKGKDLFGRPTPLLIQGVTHTKDLGSLQGPYYGWHHQEQPNGSVWPNVTNEPFTLQFTYPKHGKAVGEKTYTLDIQSGTQDGNKDIVIEVYRFKGPKRVQ